MILVAAPANDIDQPQHTLEYRRALANQSYPCTFEARKCLSLCCTLECNSIEQSVQGCGMTLSVYCGLTATFSPVFAGWNVQCCLRPYGVLWTGGRGWCTLRTSLSGTFLQTLPDLLTSLKGTLYLRAAVHRRGQRPPKGCGSNLAPGTHVNMRRIHPR